MIKVFPAKENLIYQTVESGLNGKLKQTLSREPLAIDNPTFEMKVKLIRVVFMDYSVLNSFTSHMVFFLILQPSSNLCDISHKSSALVELKKDYACVISHTIRFYMMMHS